MIVIVTGSLRTIWIEVMIVKVIVIMIKQSEHKHDSVSSRDNHSTNERDRNNGCGSKKTIEIVLRPLRK